MNLLDFLFGRKWALKREKERRRSAVAEAVQLRHEVYDLSGQLKGLEKDNRRLKWDLSSKQNAYEEQGQMMANLQNALERQETTSERRLTQVRNVSDN